MNRRFETGAAPHMPPPATVGGVMRQVGFMAAAAQYALENNCTRLASDHENARLLAEGLYGTEGVDIDLDGVQTNMVYVDVAAGTKRASELVAQLDNQGIRTLNVGPRIRFVTSMLVSRQDCERAVITLQGLMKAHA